MMRLRGGGIAGVLVALVLCAAPAPALARSGASFDFLFNMDRVSNDNQYFLNVAVSNYGYDRVVLEPVLPRLRYVEADLPVVLFLADECGRPPEYIVDLRARGLSWAVIFNRVEVPYDRLFVGIRNDPGPPYGNAWGHWRRDRRGVRLSDSDISGLVQVQIGARAARMRPYEMARARGQGRPVAYVVAEERGRPYHGGRRGNDQHEGRGRDKEHGRHHDHHEDHGDHDHHGNHDNND
jgi:hypothetical protein